MIRRVLLLTLATLAASVASLQAAVPLQSKQVVLVLTSDWDATVGALHTFERIDGEWQSHTREVPVTIGRAGSAWGLGLHDAQAGKQKVEGDGRSPAGVFSIGEAFGYEAAVRSGLSYRALSEFDYCIDVDAPLLYNRIVDAREVSSAVVAKSTEPMRRDIHLNDSLYKLGFVIHHNSRNVAGKGSCIFTHVWRSSHAPTAGCTALDETVLSGLVEWLDRNLYPVFVLLPEAEYEKNQERWGLPDVNRVAANTGDPP